MKNITYTHQFGTISCRTRNWSSTSFVSTILWINSVKLERRINFDVLNFLALSLHIFSLSVCKLSILVSFQYWLSKSEINTKKIRPFEFLESKCTQEGINSFFNDGILCYSVTHISIHPSKELCSKMAPKEVGVSLPWWCHTLVLPPTGYWGLFLDLIIVS